MSIQIDNGDYVDDGLEWWEMPKPIITPEKLARWEAERIAKAEREREWRAVMRFQNEARRVKKTLLAQRGQICQHCGRHGKRLHLHHITHIAHGGTNDPSNLILLCRDCHELEHGHGVGA